jgi:hypothetical protein
MGKFRFNARKTLMHQLHDIGVEINKSKHLTNKQLQEILDKKTVGIYDRIKGNYQPHR